jgi:hypothetical protein
VCPKLPFSFHCYSHPIHFGRSFVSLLLTTAVVGAGVDIIKVKELLGTGM